MSRLPLLAVLAVLCALAAGCGGSKPPPVASLTTTPGAPTGSGARASAKPSREAFATCLTEHGFAAAVGSGPAPGRTVSVFGVTVTGNVDPASPQFQAAMAACRKYLPGGGPPALTPAEQAEWTKAMSRFAACVRANGLPSFPDPTGAGRFPPGAMAAIDVGSPLVQKAFKACVSLEPKVGPRVSF